MKPFQLHPKLANDCFILGKLTFSQVLLMNNAALPWFILVPETPRLELCDLPPPQQLQFLEEINAISHYIQHQHPGYKLNVAMIGNIVQQLHVHVVGRNPTDYCWPQVVWGHPISQHYAAEQIPPLVAKLKTYLGAAFQPI